MELVYHMFRQILYRGPATVVQGEKRLAARECPIDFEPYIEGLRHRGIKSWYGTFELESPADGRDLAPGAAVLELESGSIASVVLTSTHWAIAAMRDSVVRRDLR